MEEYSHLPQLTGDTFASQRERNWKRACAPQQVETNDENPPKAGGGQPSVS